MLRLFLILHITIAISFGGHAIYLQGSDAVASETALKSIDLEPKEDDLCKELQIPRLRSLDRRLDGATLVFVTESHLTAPLRYFSSLLRPPIA